MLLPAPTIIAIDEDMYAEQLVNRVLYQLKCAIDPDDVGCAQQV